MDILDWITFFSLPILILMGLQAVRIVLEKSASREGYITFGGDDFYQARKTSNDPHGAMMIARINFDMEDSAFEHLINRIKANYLPWFKQLDAKIRHRPPGGKFVEPLEILDDYKFFILPIDPLLSKIVIYQKSKAITLVGNHVYLGGYQLSQFVQSVFCSGLSKNVFPYNRYIPLATELMMLGLLGQLFTRKKHVKSRLFAEKSAIHRFHCKQPLEQIQARADAIGIHYLYMLMAEHIFLVMKHLSKPRLRVTLPVTFSNESSFNTVGAIFLDLERTSDRNNLAHQIRKLVKRRHWQVSAANHIQRILPTRHLSQGARNTVDFTFTIVPQKTLPDNLLTDEMLDYEFTMDSIQYPVYAMAFIFEGNVHTSFMINSPDFDINSFVSSQDMHPMDLTFSVDS